MSPLELKDGRITDIEDPGTLDPDDTFSDPKEALAAAAEGRISGKNPVVVKGDRALFHACPYEDCSGLILSPDSDSHFPFWTSCGHDVYLKFAVGEVTPEQEEVAGCPSAQVFLGFITKEEADRLQVSQYFILGGFDFEDGPPEEGLNILER